MTTTDKPRKMLIVHPSEVMEQQRLVSSLGFNDVLVKGDSIVEPGQGYVLDLTRLDAPILVYPQALSARSQEATDV